LLGGDNKKPYLGGKTVRGKTNFFEGTGFSPYFKRSE
jgi:hypothetical protein